MRKSVTHYKILLSYLVFFIVITTAASASAVDIMVTQQLTNDAFIPNVNVNSSNGLNYDIIADQPFVMKTWIGGTCDAPIQFAGVRIDDWEEARENAVLTIAPLSTSMHPHPVILPSGGIVQTSATQIPQHMQAKMFHACYNKMLESGLPKEEAFNQDYFIEKFEFAEMIGYMSCNDYNNPVAEIGDGNRFKTAPALVNINCKKYTPPGGVAPPPGDQAAGDGLVQVVHVTASNLVSTPNTTGGKCEVAINATIETDGQTTVNYLFENEQGNKSAVRSVNVGGSHKAQFTETYDFSKPEESLGFPPPPGNAPSGPSYGVTPTDNVQGYFKMVGVSHPFESNLASYNINCEEPPQGGQGQAVGGLSGGSGNQQVQPAQIATLKLPDLVYSDGMQIGGKNVNWGSKIKISSSKAESKAGGYCTYNYIVHVKNDGNAPTGAFEYRMRAGKKSVTGTHAGIAPGKSSVIMGQVPLKAGKNDIIVAFDNMNKIVESNDDNNITKAVNVKVKGNCK